MGTSACLLDPDDPLLKEEINEDWIDLAYERIGREFVRQLQLQERSVMTTNGDTRLKNVRSLDQLQRTLERIARGASAASLRRATKHAVHPDDAVNTLQRSLLPKLERAADERDHRDVEAG
ncbi:MAG: hypothetical protein WDM91_13995 [Rhizomicrobium sp.]